MADELRRQLPEGDTLVVPADDAHAADAAEVEVVVGSNRERRVRAILAAAPGVRWYHSVGAGVEEIAGLRELRERGIVLTNNSGSYDVQIAEHAIALVLAAAKRLHVYRDQQARAEWKEHPQDELRDATLVVYGLGSIGAETARLAAALGMRVLGVRRRHGAVPGVERVVPPERLREVAAEADHLVVAAPLTPATRGSIDAGILAAMKPTAWIVNIARGQIIDTPALVGALRAKRIGGAALDAFDDEPLPAESPLWGFENVIVTPHSSNSSPRLMQRTLALFLENLRRYKAEEPLLNRVDYDAGY